MKKFAAYFQLHKMPHEDIQLKRLDVADAALLSAIATNVYSEHYADTWQDNGEWYLQTYLSVSRLAKELQDANAWFFLVSYKQEAVGFLKLNIDKPLPGVQKNSLELERIYLKKSASGNGIGTHLLHFAFEIAVQQNKELVWLKAMDTSPDAVRFYKKMGFEICGTHHVDFIQKKEGMRGMYVMQKNV